ncbi:proteasome subunit alpha type [Culex quinquefasciatus]|uniref:Proteasome subunit alpha type n=1 Tax=Culex quinquefasciatus TaxID=7176 RepID=B0XJS2_CULQU|nr:proteasome subunit alpha type [Culex quinquefasciatus]|eukprot:XP_001869894.1 proteasome subunit alpha type [Culex quinquefasciatus]
MSGRSQGRRNKRKFSNLARLKELADFLYPFFRVFVSIADLSKRRVRATVGSSCSGNLLQVPIIPSTTFPVAHGPVKDDVKTTGLSNEGGQQIFQEFYLQTMTIRSALETETERPSPKSANKACEIVESGADTPMPSPSVSRQRDGVDRTTDKQKNDSPVHHLVVFRHDKKENNQLLPVKENIPPATLQSTTAAWSRDTHVPIVPRRWPPSLPIARADPVPNGGRFQLFRRHQAIFRGVQHTSLSVLVITAAVGANDSLTSGSSSLHHPQYQCQDQHSLQQQ